MNSLLVFLFFLLFTLVSPHTQALENWPCWHGPDRTNKSTETGLLKKWPDSGPQLLWTVTDLGEGYSSVSLAGNYLYTAGNKNQETVIFAFDRQGTLQWKKANGKAWTTTRSWARSYTGSRSTPTYDQGIIYHLGESGRLTAMQAQNGDVLWSRELSTDFSAENPEYGYSESVLIEGDYLYCRVAGDKAFALCLNKKTGKVIWNLKGVPGSLAYNSPVLINSNGYRQILGMSSNTLYGANAKTGQLLWQIPFENNRDNNCTDPIFHQGYVFASSGYGKGSILIELLSVGIKIEPKIVWQTTNLDNHHGGVIFHEGYLYGSGHDARGWFCLDFMTGKKMWQTPGKGALVYGEGMLYCLEEKGTMKLIKAQADKCEIVSRFKVPQGGKGMYWAHPVICNGRLYIRHSDKLFAYDIKSK